MDSPFDQPTIPQPGGRYQAGLKVFGGRFVLERRIGRGGMGEVWLATDTELGDGRALKFLPSEVAADPKALAQLRREAIAGRRLSHPRIVRVDDFYSDSAAGMAAVAMEYVEGRTLNEIQAETEKGYFEVAEIEGWIRDVCEALEYAHGEAKVVHRDLKPSNIIIEASTGRAKVLDFGIARRIAETHTQLTGKDSSGTLAYMSPQQVDGERGLPSDDVYALGATIYELLTGTPPFFRGDLRKQIETKAPPSMTARRAELAEEGMILEGGSLILASWERLTAACLAKQSGDRPAGVREMLRSFERGVVIPVTQGREVERPNAEASHDEALRPEFSTPTDTFARSTRPVSPAYEKVWDEPREAPSSEERPMEPPAARAEPPRSQRQSSKGLWGGIGTAAAAVVLGGLLFAVTRGSNKGGANSQNSAHDGSGSAIFVDPAPTHPRQTGRLDFTVDPPNAARKVEMTRSAVGDRSEEREYKAHEWGRLPTGTYRLTVNDSTLGTKSETIEIIAERTTSKSLRLDNYGRLHVTSTPTGARVYIDGKDTGETTPFTSGLLKTGNHLVFVKKEGYKETDARLVGLESNGARKAIDFNLIPHNSQIAPRNTNVGAATVSENSTNFPSANPVPGKIGFVFSPYTNKILDVGGIPQGTLVEDPTSGKRFRVP